MNGTRVILDSAHRFLSIQAQDFIEERAMTGRAGAVPATFLSIQAQDFIEDPQIKQAISQHYSHS